MKFFSTVIEQLDRALDELGSSSAIGSRIALILVDNAVELLIHQSCEHYAKHGTQEGALSPHVRREATGTNLDAKFALLRRVGDLTESQARFVAICHSYRNELYHVGVRHDDILRHLAKEYLQLACDFLPRMGPRSIGWGPKLELGSRVLRYVGEDYRLTSIFHNRAPIAAALLARLPELPVAFPTQLKANLLERIETIAKHFDLISRGLDGQADPADTLRELQFTFDHNQMLSKKKGDVVWIPWSHPGLREHRKRLEATWRQQFRRVPTVQWRNKANVIGKISDPLEATIQHRDLNAQMDYLDGAIKEALYEFDGIVQSQIDRIRGK